MEAFVNDLVANEESSNIVVLLKFVHDQFVGIELRFRPHRVCVYDLGGKSVQVHEEVDSRVGKCLHAAAMVAIYDVVDSDGVGSECFHELGVKLALVGVE